MSQHSPLRSINSSGNPPPVSQQNLLINTDVLVTGGHVKPRSVSPADDALSLLEDPTELGLFGDGSGDRQMANMGTGSATPNGIMSASMNNGKTQPMRNTKDVASVHNMTNNNTEVSSEPAHNKLNQNGSPSSTPNSGDGRFMTVAADIHNSESMNTHLMDNIVTSTPVTQQRNKVSVMSSPRVLDTSLNSCDNVISILDTSDIKEHTGRVENGANSNSHPENTSSLSAHLNNTSSRINGEDNKVVRSRSGSGSGPDSPASYHSITKRGSIGGNRSRNESFTSSGTQTSTDFGNRIKTPILGYEVMEERARFTVFKIQVKMTAHDSWFIFRRYRDFTRLNDKLREMFPMFRLSLPPKRWFSDNYDKEFLDKRKRGLQAFLNNVMGHSEASESAPAKEFLCLDNPPVGHETLEESKAMCESMEEEIYHLHQDIEERDARISLLQEELDLQRLEIENLKKTLKYERTGRRRPSGQSLVSLGETSALAEADQQRLNNIAKRSSKENSPYKKSPSKDRLSNKSPCSIQEGNEDDNEQESSSTESSSPDKNFHPENNKIDSVAAAHNQNSIKTLGSDKNSSVTLEDDKMSSKT